MSKVSALSVIALAAVALAACGGGSSQAAKKSNGSPDPGTKFSTAKVAGLGTVVVDGKGRTVYILTSAAKKNVPCTDDSGCTDVWPDLSLPDGTTSATAGAGVDASLLGTAKANGETYPTYNGYLLYEYASDTAPGQANGEGITSYGGTWYTLDSSGMPVKQSMSDGGYSY